MEINLICFVQRRAWHTSLPDPSPPFLVLPSSSPHTGVPAVRWLPLPTSIPRIPDWTHSFQLPSFWGFISLGSLPSKTEYCAVSELALVLGSSPKLDKSKTVSESWHFFIWRDGNNDPSPFYLPTLEWASNKGECLEAFWKPIIHHKILTVTNNLVYLHPVRYFPFPGSLLQSYCNSFNQMEKVEIHAFVWHLIKIYKACTSNLLS